MKEFIPDYKNVVMAARNIKPERMPLYDHVISDKIMESILNKKFSELRYGSKADKLEYFKNYTYFYKTMGYDTVSFECGIAPILPGSGALRSHMPGSIKNRKDFIKYPWESIHDKFFDTYDDYFKSLGEVMPGGMKAVGGPGFGVFECVQDIVGYMDLCYISQDDPKLYGDLFAKMGEIIKSIWSTFLKKYGDIYAVCRFGDDLGFRSSTLISPEDIRRHIIPQYRLIIGLIHSYNKPFLFHSCGNIFCIMDDVIDTAMIDAKHSNEDAIAPFRVWVENYGDRIGNFGGIDTDILCRENENFIQNYVKEVVGYCINHGGFALGSGNSIPGYVPVEGYLAMNETGRKLRGE